MEGYNSSVGVGMLDIALGKIYHDPFVIFREYIQNACDSIELASRDGYFKSDAEKTVAIKITKKNISFEDRGVGVSITSIGKVLVDVGNSTKYGTDLIGKYGIGRLIAARYCDKIVFETSAKGENKKSILTWDMKKAIQAIDTRSSKRINEIIDDVTECVYESEDENSHFFNVYLENINNDQLLDETAVAQFIAETAPVDYKFEFKDDLLNPALDSTFQSFCKRMSEQRHYNITLNGKQIFKLYNPTADKANNGGTEALTMPIFFELKDYKYGELAWGWYSLTESAQQMNSVQFRGIRLRQHNMAIGKHDALTSFFPKPVDSNYFVGELFITNDNINPSGSRDGLTNSPEAECFKIELKSKLKELHEVYDGMSKIGSQCLNKISAAYLEKQKKMIELKSETDRQKKKELREEIKVQETIIQDKTKELTSKVDTLKSHEGGDALYGSITRHTESLLKQKIDEHNSQKKNDTRSKKIKNTDLTTIIESVDTTADPVVEEEPITILSPVDEYISTLDKNGKKIFSKLKDVLNSEKMLTPDMVNKIMESLVKKLKK